MVDNNSDKQDDEIGRTAAGTEYPEERPVDKKNGSLDSVDELKAENELLRAKVDELLESERLKMAFLNNISREIQTPLNTLTGFCAYLSDPGLSYEKRAAFLKIILESSDHLQFIITDLVNIAAIESGNEKIQKNEFNLNLIFRILYKQYSLRASEQGNLFKYKTGLPDNEDRIITDRTKLTRIISNLLNNAIKFTGQGKIIFGYRLKGDFIEFYVKDTGIGIPEELQKNIFERFREVDNSDNRYYGGSGLGLSISKAYIEMLDGTIWLKSQPGIGSTFYFTLPHTKP